MCSNCCTPVRQPCKFARTNRKNCQTKNKSGCALPFTYQRAAERGARQTAPADRHPNGVHASLHGRMEDGGRRGVSESLLLRVPKIVSFHEYQWHYQANFAWTKPIVRTLKTSCLHCNARHFLTSCTAFAVPRQPRDAFIYANAGIFGGREAKRGEGVFQNYGSDTHNSMGPVGVRPYARAQTKTRPAAEAWPFALTNANSNLEKDCAEA